MTEPLVIVRHVAAPPGRVWSLWTTTEGLAEWWWSLLPGTTYDVDLRVGGNYRIENPAAGIGVRGTFRVVDHGRRFVATWVWLDGTSEGQMEHLEVRFEPDGAATNLTIVHDGPWNTPEPAAAYARGWSDTLAALDTLFVANANAWLGRRVIGIAHQGGAVEGPPNTIETMRKALENGCAALEFDVHVTRDGQLVLHHDPEFMVDGNVVEIADTNLDALCALKPDLATVGEVLAAFPEVPLTVEVKAPKAAELTARMLAEEPGSRPVIVTAFASGTVAAVKRVAPGLDTAPGWSTNFGFWLTSRLWRSPPLGKGHVALQVPFRLDQVAIVKRVPLLRRLRIADRRLVNAAHRRGLAVHVWTLNDDVAMRAALDFGADGIFTDDPSVLTTTLKATDNYWRR